MTDTLSRLGAVPEVDAGSITDNTDERRSNIAWDFESGYAEEGGVVRFADGVVAMVTFYTDSLLVKDLVNALGVPEQVLSYSGCADGRWLAVDLLYPSRGIAIALFDFTWPGDQPPEVRPDIEVAGVSYFDPERYDQLLHSRGLISQEYSQVQSGMQPWRGYGSLTYADLCP